MKRKVIARLTNGSAQLDCGHVVDTSESTEAECSACVERRIPEQATPGRKTPTFTADTVPPALLDTHRTSAWAELVVESGAVSFRDMPDGYSATATPNSPVSIVPEQPHCIEPGEDARFYVQFHDLPK
jgi:tellurite resistance-related uncharacterized protein